MANPDANFPVAPHLASTYVVTGADGGAVPVAVTEAFWRELPTRFGNFAGRLLIAQFDFDTDWPSWEMHPHGDEVVYLLSGAVDFLLEEAGGVRTVVLDQPGTFVIVPRAVWHTAKVRASASMLFVTPGRDTQHRPV